MMKIKIFHTLALCALLISACNIPIPKMDGGNSAAIIHPVDGAQFQIGDVVDVKTLVDFSAGASSAILLVNDSPYRVDHFSQPIPAGYIFQPWTPTEPGTYTLGVRLVGSDGEVDSNSVTVIVGASAPAEAPTLPSVPTVETPAATLSSAGTATQTPFFPSATIPAAVVPTLTPTPAAVVPTLTSTVIVVLPTFTEIIPANASISGLIYRDENGNGNFNPADSPLAGITVQLGAGSCPASGFQVAQTGGDGKYTFSALTAGQYCITVDAASLPSIGGTWMPSLPNPKDVNLGAGENKGGQNFMFQPVIQ
ncbi:MAG: SdrD B-like domain-containing protein [bacterium]|nr:SdrD B-like domain-containing protein [bacterium]